jgi:hypothetical protein
VKYRLIGELLFQARNKGLAAVRVYRGQSSFRLTRAVDPSIIEEVSKVDPYNGDISRYILEATLKWTDLEREGVQWKPQSENRDLNAGQVGTF